MIDDKTEYVAKTEYVEHDEHSDGDDTKNFFIGRPSRTEPMSASILEEVKSKREQKRKKQANKLRVWRGLGV